MSEALVKHNPNAVKSMVMQTILRGEFTTVEELVEELSLPIEQVIDVVTQPEFVEALSKYSSSQATLNYHLRAVPKVISLVDSDDDKVALSAVKLLGELTGTRKKDNGVTVNVSLEQKVNEAEKVNAAVDAIDVFDVEEVMSPDFRKQ